MGMGDDEEMGEHEQYHDCSGPLRWEYLEDCKDCGELACYLCHVCPEGWNGG